MIALIMPRRMRRNRCERRRIPTLIGIIRRSALWILCRYRHKTHWTSKKTRLDRDLSRYAKDRSARAREELVAELGSAFLCADLGIAPELQPRSDHASYIGSWLNVLRDDKRAIFQAAAQAQRAANYLHYLQPHIEGEGEAT
jgi:antirestriction protein ArdC